MTASRASSRHKKVRRPESEGAAESVKVWGWAYQLAFIARDTAF